MKVEVLVAAVEKDAKQLAQTMRLATDAVIVSQGKDEKYEEFENNGRKIRCFYMKARGVGLNRNTALQRAKGDIILFCDEDIVLDPGYEETILKAFEKNKGADLLTFNVRVDERRRTYYNTDVHRIRWYNYGRYPAYAIAARRKALEAGRILFSLLFGGGAKYSNGEDSLFLRDCLKSGLKMYTQTAEIGEEVYRESTWFHGYTDKFFVDRGVLYHFLYGKMALVWTWRFLLTKRNVICKDIPVQRAYRLMKKGIRQAKKIR